MGRRQFGSVRRLPSGRWQARYWTQTGEERTARQTFATKGDASRFLARVQTEMDRGEWHDPRLARITFGRWVEEYLAGARHKRPTTRARDEVVLRTHFLPELGRRPLAAITPLDVRRLVEDMAQRLAPATVRTNYGVLKTVFSAAVEADVIVRSPCRGVKLPAARPRERSTLTADDLHRLAAAVPPPYRPVVYVAGVLGLRWSEVAGLRVRHLDFLRRTLTVAETVAEVGGRLQPAATKSRAGTRTLAVPPFVMPAHSTGRAGAARARTSSGRSRCSLPPRRATRSWRRRLGSRFRPARAPPSTWWSGSPARPRPTLARPSSRRAGRRATPPAASPGTSSTTPGRSRTAAGPLLPERVGAASRPCLRA